MNMGYKSILVVSDNEVILAAFTQYLQESPELAADRTFTFVCGPKHDALQGKVFGGYTINPLSMKTEYEPIISTYDLVISAHSKQIFPEALVKAVTCINIHPGYNPYNRGWFPQVFSILNGLPLGATIHEIDEQLDHGRIIAQEKVPVHAWDTSLSAYNRVQELEIQLLRQYLPQILNGTYKAFPPKEEGNLNLKKDFDALREIDLNQTLTFREAIDKLRALSHAPFRNAYFIDPDTGKRVWIGVELEKDEDASGD
jgi:methionyl-tRNA formyltransferase